MFQSTLYVPINTIYKIWEAILYCLKNNKNTQKYYWGIKDEHISFFMLQEKNISEIFFKNIISLLQGSFRHGGRGSKSSHNRIFEMFMSHAFWCYIMPLLCFFLSKNGLLEPPCVGTVQLKISCLLYIERKNLIEIKELFNSNLSEKISKEKPLKPNAWFLSFYTSFIRVSP